jgi:hypothetical protein
VKTSLVAALVLLLVTSAHAQEREPVPPPQDPSVATIRGDVVSGIFGKSGTRVAAFDGRTIYGPEESCFRHDLTPGPHSLVVAAGGTLAPLRLDAEAGATYVIRETGDAIAIEETNSGKTVFRMSESIAGTIPPYAPPARGEGDAATLRAEQKMRTGLLGENNDGWIYLHTIDGTSLPEKTESIATAPGIHALTISVSKGTPFTLYSASPLIMGSGNPAAWWQVFPILIDVMPGHIYVVKHGGISVGNFSAQTTVWIEDESDGKEVTPRYAVAMNAVNRGVTYYAGLHYDTKVSFPDGKGQLKRSPPRKKQWCERD